MDKAQLESLLIVPEVSVKQAMQKLSETLQRILFVTDSNRRLLGTVNDGDIRRAIINGVAFNENVGNIMQKDFTAIPLAKSKDREEVKNLMISKKIEQIPVLDENGFIIDLIVWLDILGEKSTFLATHSAQSNQVVIMAGGKGSRLDPFTRILPKALIPVGNKPIVELIMEKFNKCGFHNFIYTLNYKKEYLKMFFKESSYPYDIRWVEEDSFLGTAGSLSLLKNSVDESFFISNCDSLLDADFGEILSWHKKAGAAVTVVGCHNEVKIPFGVLEISNGELERIREKPVHDIIINTGVYVMEPHVISYIPEGKPMDMNELLDLIGKQEKITVYPIYEGWFDIGRWEEYQKNIQKIEGLDYV